MMWRSLAFSMILPMCSISQALAHASLLEAIPQPGAVVAGDNVSIELRFDSRLDARLVLSVDGHANQGEIKFQIGR